MDRDALLAAALGAAVLTGCTGRARRNPAPLPSASPLSPTPSAAADPDVETLLSWAGSERAIAVRYGRLARLVPALAPLRRNHLARAEAVEEQLAFRGVPPPAAPSAGPLAGKPAALVRAFGDAERRLATAYLADLRGLRDSGLAMLGAELAAGARQHAAVLAVARVPG